MVDVKEVIAVVATDVEEPDAEVQLLRDAIALAFGRKSIYRKFFISSAEIPPLSKRFSVVPTTLPIQLVSPAKAGIVVTKAAITT